MDLANSGGLNRSANSAGELGDEAMRSTEIIFEVTESDEGGFEARALGHSIFTHGEDWNDLKEMTRDAVRCHFDEAEAPKMIRLHLIREEAITV